MKATPVYGIVHNNNVRVGLELTKQEKWNIGSCSSAGIYPEWLPNKMGDVTRTFVRSCWLVPGQHVLECYSKNYSAGWTNAYIEIQGHRYCDDFISIKAFRNIIIAGIFFYKLRGMSLF